jgi:hypothetical protein
MTTCGTIIEPEGSGLGAMAERVETRGRLALIRDKGRMNYWAHADTHTSLGHPDKREEVHQGHGGGPRTQPLSAAVVPQAVAVVAFDAAGLVPGSSRFLFWALHWAISQRAGPRQEAHEWVVG